MSQSRRGFTLLELLVVIGIIAVLVAILLPVANGARRAAKTVRCLANLQQIAQAEFTYSIDYKGRLATGSPGDVGLNAYAGQIKTAHLFTGTTPINQAPQILIDNKYLVPEIFYCPGREAGDRYTYDDPNYGWNAVNAGMQWREISYVMGHSLNGKPVGMKDYGNWYRMGKSSGDLVFAYEVCFTDATAPFGSAAKFGWSKHGHGKGYNMAFCDGSARWVQDYGDLLEPMWVIDFFTNEEGHRRIMMDLLGWDQQRYWKYCPPN